MTFEPPSMYQTPTRGDFQRNLSGIIHEARAKIRAENGRIINSLAAKGLVQSGALISETVSCANNLHIQTIKKSMHLLQEFIHRSQMTPAELGDAARPLLENLEIEWLAPLRTGQYPQPQGQQIATQYAQVFRQRLDGALRDIEIGFIGGQNVAPQSEQTIQTNAFRLLEIMEKATRGSSTPVILGNLPDLGGLNEEEAKEAYHYLQGKGLIDPSNFGYAARVSADGHDALRDAQLTPDKSTSAFPSITYNILNIETMTGSNIQQGTAHSQITATKTITTQQFVENVQQLVDQVERALPTSDLPTEVQEQTKAIMAELRAAASEQTPDTGRLRRGLEALKRIMEHTAGHLVAAGVLNLIAPLLHATVAH